MIVNNLRKSIGNKEILSNITFSLNGKVGLVGVNGSGKSTLIKILSGELNYDSGNINYNNESVAYLKQEIPSKYNNYTVVDYIKEEVGIDYLERRLHELENNLFEDKMEEYGEVLNEYLSLDGYSFDGNLKKVFTGLQLNIDFNKEVHTLSGGEKIKVLLSVLLLKNSDVLLLDEPTNNLDVEAIEWLENYLTDSKKKMLIVSHDEFFLNNIVDKIYELDNGIITEYNMSYDEYLNQKELEYNHLRDEYLNNKHEKDKLRKQIKQASSWANKGLKNRSFNDNDKIANNFQKERTNTSSISKLKRELNKMDDIYFEEKEPINVFFNYVDSKGNRDIILNDLVCGYESFNTPVLKLDIPFGTKLNVFGPNGSGKSTLIKTILGELKPISGSIMIGNDSKIGYISQDTYLDNDESIYSYLTNGNDDFDKSLIFTLLIKFNIRYEDKDKLYKDLSPGERTRVNIVKLVLNNINILILDEITNHLDKEALDLIYELVSDFPGTIISVSHNRKYNEYLNSNIELDIRDGKVLNNH